MIGIEIDSITADEVVCSLCVEHHHFNLGGNVQGGAIFTLADFAFAIACNYDDLANGKQAATVGQSCNIIFLKPPMGKKLIAKSKCIQKGRKISVYRVTVTDEKETNVAEMTGNAYTVTLDNFPKLSMKNE